jgi:uncharacterized Tic20 family protein
MPTSNEKLWAAGAHLSYLIGLPLVFPLILFAVMRDKSTFVAAQAKQAVALHLSIIVAAFLGAAFAFGTFGFGVLVTVPAMCCLLLAAIVFTVIAVIKVSQGEHYRYPIIGGMLDAF